MENKIKKSFTQVPNGLINDNSISRDARFLFVYLCSKPENWVFRTSLIENDLNCSKDTRIKYMKELIDKGWITTYQVKKEGGAFGNVEIELNPYPNFSDAVKTRGGKTTPLNNTNDKLLYTIKDLYKIRMCELSISHDRTQIITPRFEVKLSSDQIKYFEIAEHFRNLFIKNLTEKEAPIRDQKNATYKNYVDPIRLCVERDEFTMDNLRDAYEYLDSPAGEFWKTNILSTSKLREQMPKLIASKNFRHKKTA